MLESEIEGKMVQALKRRGAMAVKLECPVAGIPDRLVILPGGRIIFVQLKRETGRLSKAQMGMIDRLSNLGCDVRVLYGLQQVNRFLEEVMPDGV